MLAGCLNEISARLRWYIQRYFPICFINIQYISKYGERKDVHHCFKRQKLDNLVLRISINYYSLERNTTCPRILTQSRQLKVPVL